MDMCTRYGVGAAVVILAAGLLVTLRFAVTADDRLADVRINVHPGRAWTGAAAVGAAWAILGWAAD